MTRAEILKEIKAARAEFEAEQWGWDDNVAVDAFIKILKKHFPKEKNTPVDPKP